jgi:hypothetical protein
MASGQRMIVQIHSILPGSTKDLIGFKQLLIAAKNNENPIRNVGIM